MKRSGENGLGGGFGCCGNSKRIHMDAYDSLPPRLRLAVGYHNRKICCVLLHELYGEGDWIFNNAGVRSAINKLGKG